MKNKNIKIGLVSIFALTAGITSGLYFWGDSEPVYSQNENLVDDFYNDLYNVQDSRVRIIYFGYTNCPDVCPTSLATLSMALKNISDEQLAQVRPIFISLDSKRDTFDIVDEYAKYFHSSIEGMSTKYKNIEYLAHKYGVLFRFSQLNHSEIEYTVDHNSYFYFTSPDGELLEKIPHTLNYNILRDAIERFTKT